MAIHAIITGGRTVVSYHWEGNERILDTLDVIAFYRMYRYLQYSKPYTWIYPCIYSWSYTCVYTSSYTCLYTCICTCTCT